MINREYKLNNGQYNRLQKIKSSKLWTVTDVQFSIAGRLLVYVTMNDNMIINNQKYVKYIIGVRGGVNWREYSDKPFIN